MTAQFINIKLLNILLNKSIGSCANLPLWCFVALNAAAACSPCPADGVLLSAAAKFWTEWRVLLRDKLLG